MATTEKVYKRISELDGLTGDLTGAELLPIVKSGKTFKRQLSEIYGDSWFSALRSKLADFIAPNATKADQTNYAALSADAEAVNGISFETGRGKDLWEEIEISPGGFWIIPSGSFLIYAWSVAALASLIVEVDDARVPGTWGLRAPFPAGLVLSDGISQRIRNQSAVKVGLTYRVLAHA